MKKAVASLLLVVLVAGLILAGCAPAPAPTPTPEPTPEPTAKPFYEGETITLIVATKPGGGYDLYGRMVGRFMQEHLPGSTIIVKNVPGAGHIVGCNEIYYAKPDGLTFGVFNRALPLAQVAELEGVKFNLAEMSWLGSPSVEPYCFIISTETPLRSLEDVRKADEVILSSAGIGSQSHVVALMFAEMTGLKNLKIVPGFGGGEAELAMMRGEIEGQFGSWSSLEPFVEEGNAVPVMFIAEEPITGYEDVPLVRDVITGEKYKPAVDVLLSTGMIGRPFAGPPDIPPDRLQILQQAFEEAICDPEFVEMGGKLGRPVEYVSGEQAKALLKSLLELPPDVVELIKSSYAG